MDALIVLIIGLVLAKGFEVKKEKVRAVVSPPDLQQERRKNPNFIKHEDAFMSLFNNIMKKG